MATGGLVLETIPDSERRSPAIPDTGMALRVKHVGQYGPHAAAQNAGFRKGDVVIAFDGQTDLLREADLLAYALRNRKPGERAKVSLVRDGKKMELMLPMQE